MSKSSNNNITDNNICGISDNTISKCSNDIAIIPIATAASHSKASYEDVVANYGLFMETLQDLHHSLNSKFLVPTIGGKPLDIHRLFVEVTQRGGFEKVTLERRWREVSTAFSFPSTATNASFLLRKHYVPILQKYELVYFLHESPELSTKDKSEGSFLISNDSIANKYQVKLTHQIPNEGNDSFELSDANIAYVFKVNSTQQISNKQETSLSTPRKRKRKENDSQIITGFNLFFVEHYSNLRPLYSGKEKAIIKQINLLWSNLSESEKEVYQARDKARCENT